MPTAPTPLELAARTAVAEHLRRNGLRQYDVAVALGLSQPSVSDRLCGKTPFTLADLDGLAAFLGLPVEDLIRQRAS